MLLRQRLILSLSALLVLGFLTTSLASYYVSRSSLRSKIITNDLPLTSDNIYSEIQRDLLRPIFISSLMANDTFLRDWVLNGEKEVDEISKYLREIKDKYHTCASFFVSEKSKNYYYGDGILKMVREEEPRDRWYFRVRLMKPDYEINVDPDLANKDTVTIFINHKVFDYNGGILGATGVGLRISAVKQLIESYHSKYKRTIYFVSSEGDVVLQSAAQGAGAVGNIKNMPGVSEVADMVLSGKSDQHAYVRDGRNIYLNTRFIPELNWFLLVEQGDSQISGSIFSTLILNLVICGMITLVVILLTRMTINSYQNKLEVVMKADLELKSINQGQQREIESQHLELLEKNTALARLNSSKDKLFSIIAHDLRTPIGNITQLLELLSDAFASGSRNEATELLRRLKDSSESAFKLLENLFDWARNQITETSYTPREVNLKWLLLECVDSQHFAAEAKGIMVEVRCDEGVNAWADGNMVKAIVRNLISNAIKFTPERGWIRVAAVLAQGKVCVSVQDSGMGIERERLATIFDFSQNKNTSGTNGESGTGLGLSLCKDLVVRNNGELLVDSEVGKGSTFSFTLPVAASSAAGVCS